MKIGFIGFGNMAQALAEGFLLKQAAAPEDIYACARNWEKLQSAPTWWWWRSSPIR